MDFRTGAQLNQYAIVEKIGEGGMGTVYSADDTTLGRRVALKVLAEEFSSDPQRLRRFEREARTVAALNHPNVVTLYSVESVDGTHFLTMEMIDGHSLAELIPKRGFDLKRFFRLAIPITEAVAAAHARGIAHRDLKPNNVMVNNAGRVKVLDFGLAKVIEGESGYHLQTQLPTEAVTVSGMIVGTVSYMSPEQAQGLEVDERSDVFSLGVMLYEMVTGHKPFSGATAVSVISAILRVQPEPIARYRHSGPRQLQRIVDTCLAKNPTRRYQSILDLRNALEALREELHGDGEAAKTPVPRGVAIRSLPWLAAGAAVVAAASYLLMPGPAEDPVAGISRLDLQLVPLVASDAIMPEGPDIDPSGERVVYSAEVDGQQDLWTLELNGGIQQRITNSSAVERDPVYSPDGNQIAFSAGNAGGFGIHVMPSRGGTTVMIVAEGSSPSWSPSSDRIAYEWRGGVWVSSIAVGAGANQVAPNVGVGSSPVWVAGGSALLAWSDNEGDVVRIPVDGGERVRIDVVPTGSQVTSLATTADGNDLILAMGQYGGNKSLWHVPLDPSTGRPTGEPVFLTGQITDNSEASIAPDGSRIVFVARKVARDLYSMPLDPVTGTAVGEPERLTDTAPQNYYPSFAGTSQKLLWTAQVMGAGLLFSKDVAPGQGDEKATPEWDRSIREIGGSYAPDGRHFVYSSTKGGDYRLWQMLDGSATPRRFAHSPEDDAREFGDYLPAWSPDGASIAFQSSRSGGQDIWVADAERGTVRQLTTFEGIEEMPVWLRDSSGIVFRSLQETDADLWVADAQGNSPEVLVDTDADEAWAAWSQTGDRLYFVSDLSGRYEIWTCETDGSFACVGEENLTQITHHETSRQGLPDYYLFTKLAVAGDRLIVPLETRSAELWSLQFPGRRK